MSRQRNKFKGLITRLYGSQIAMAEALDVTPQTVQNWVNINPKGMWKYAAAIVDGGEITFTELSKEIDDYHNFLQ